MKFYCLLFLVVLPMCHQAGSSCVDKQSRCSTLKDFCSGRYVKWMKKYCPKTCNLCPSPVLGSSCVDKHTSCPAWSSSGECTKNPGYMNKNCAKSCGKCGGNGETCLTSPNYPSNYGNSEDTTEKLSVPAGKGIEITFKDLDVEANGKGCYDYLQFLDGNGKLVDKICGRRIPLSFRIKTSMATVNFRSDWSETRKGYKICYKPVSLSTTPTDNNSCLCGLAKRPKTRIVGGTETGVNEYPWLVALIMRASNFQGGKKATWQCGGTLINDRWVLTAAHCVAAKQWPYGRSWSNRTIDMVKVVLGEHDWSTKKEATSITRKVIQMEKHKNYDFDMDYDFALLKIDPPIDFKKHAHIRPACLPQTENTGPEPDAGMTGDWATVAGWGHTQYGGKNSDVTQQVNVVVQTSSQCKQDYKDLIAKKRLMPITDRMFCASVSGGGKDSCQNDSGGPIIWANGDGVTPGKNYEVKGVVSFGAACAVAGSPGVYAKVSAVLPWIKSVAKDGTECPRT